jgi:serine protease Do
VIAAVRPYSPAARAGIRPGQVLLAVNRREVSTLAEFGQAMREAVDGAVSLIVRDPQVGRVIINYEPGS